MSELKPCPFCGGEPIAIETHPGRGELYCGKCDLLLGENHAKTPEELIEAWNTRSDYAVQAENERYMELPVDADGVPIRPGDQMTDGSRRIDGLGMAKWDVVSVNERSFFDMSGNAHIPIDCHHVKPRTVEDVLFDFMCDYGNNELGNRELVDKYAVELRMRDTE